MSTEVEKEEVVESPDIHFQPLVSLPVVDVKTLEENEEEILKLRAKLFRFDTSESPPQWKERGVGDVKFLRNTKTQAVRLLMRRDKTHKICANHYLSKSMKLSPSAGSDRAWVWNVLADFADEEPKKEQLAIRFKNAEIATTFKNTFESSQASLPDLDSSSSSIADDLEKLSVSDKPSTPAKSESDDKAASSPSKDCCGSPNNKKTSPDASPGKGDDSAQSNDSEKKE